MILLVLDLCQKNLNTMYYTNYDEFANQLDDMVCDGGLREEMGKLGVQYVDRYYRWDKIIDSFSQMVEKVSDKAERKE